MKRVKVKHARDGRLKRGKERISRIKTRELRAANLELRVVENCELRAES